MLNVVNSHFPDGTPNSFSRQTPEELEEQKSNFENNLHSYQLNLEKIQNKISYLQDKIENFDGEENLKKELEKELEREENKETNIKKTIENLEVMIEKIENYL